jgi:hypothetical protein
VIKVKVIGYRGSVQILCIAVLSIGMPFLENGIKKTLMLILLLNLMVGFATNAEMIVSKSASR